MSLERGPVNDQKTELDYSSLEAKNRLLSDVDTKRKLATMRMSEFVIGKTHDDMIRKLHTSITNVDVGENEFVPVRFFTLWTDFDDLRLLETGILARHIRRPYAVEQEDGDKSVVLGRKELSEYPPLRLRTLSQQLDKLFVEPPKPQK